MLVGYAGGHMARSAKKRILQDGDRLGNYGIEALIGVGGAGEVYKARNATSGKTVAIKILLDEHAHDPEHLERLLREGHSIDHPAVLRYMDVFHTEAHGGRHYLVMEYIEGVALSKLMSEGPVPQDALLSAARTILEGLAACHAQSIFHRDISPDNIIFRDGDPARATLIDFGIAKDARPDAKTVVGQGFAGKFEYAAPEQLEGRFDGRSDLFSLGATLLAAARGKTPDLGNSFADVIRIKAQPVDSSDIGGLLGALIGRLLAVNPADRPSSPHEALTLLKAPRPNAAGPGAPEKSKGAPATPAIRRWAGPIVAAGLAFAALGAWLLWPGLPVVSPYTMTMARGADGAARAQGYAGSDAEAQALTAAMAAALGAAPSAIIITPAKGAPDDDWPSMAQAAARVLSLLERGDVVMEDQGVHISGLARTPVAKADAEALARAEAARYGFDLSSDIDLAPQTLPFAVVNDVLVLAADCGPLRATIPEGGAYAPGQPVAIGGRMSSANAAAALREKLAAVADGRAIDLEGVGVINPSACMVRQMLVSAPAKDAQMRLTSGLSGLPLDGKAVDPDEIPVLDVYAPASLEGRIHAFLVDNNYRLYHLRPAPDRPEDRLAKLGVVEGDMRRIRLMHPAPAGYAEGLVPWDPQHPHFQAEKTKDGYGAVWAYVVVTKDPLFAVARGEEEDTRDFAGDFGAALTRNPPLFVAAQELVFKER